MRVLRLAVGVLAVAVAGCEAGGGVVGEWQAEQAGQTMSIVFEADSTFTMNTGSFTGEGTYVLNDRVIELQPAGALATAVPGGFSGTLENSERLNLCSPGGLCTDFQRVQ